MKAVVIGCGRVGSAVAKGLALEGWDVTAVDGSDDALRRLGSGWSGGFVMGHGMDSRVLEQAGIAQADMAVVSTNGDNTNLVIGQLVQKRYGVPAVVRILDPARADFYRTRGLNIVSPTKTAIAGVLDAVRTGAAHRRQEEEA